MATREPGKRCKPVMRGRVIGHCASECHAGEMPALKTRGHPGLSGLPLLLGVPGGCDGGRPEGEGESLTEFQTQQRKHWTDAAKAKQGVWHPQHLYLGFRRPAVKK